MPKIKIANSSEFTGGYYQEQFGGPDAACVRRALSIAAGLTQFGVNLTLIPPGTASALRHWHEAEDELVFVILGELILIEEDGETVLRAGEAAGFKAGVADGHQLVNRSASDAVCLEIGTRAEAERGHYPDVDLLYQRSGAGEGFTDKSGKPIS